MNKNNDTSTVYVVHCIDTEGPLYESLDATFDRVEEIFGLRLNPTRQNLIKLQNGEIELNGLEDSVKNLVSPNRIKTLGSWDEIDAMLTEILSNEFRKTFQDSDGKGWIYNWFCLDHVGFNFNNPRHRDIGYHNIFDHYQSYYFEEDQTDLIQWHYHPLSIIPDAHKCGTAYLNSNNIYEILARKIIDRNWFPAVFRPGFHTERPDSHWFLEQWIPFDYGNQSVKYVDTDQPDLRDGRFGDWRRAPEEWFPYNPDFYDYQIKGNCNRYITRCLNMEARLRELTYNDVNDAFNYAENNGKALLSFTNHDWRDMRSEIKKVWNIIENVSTKHSHVSFKYLNALDAYRAVLDITELRSPEFEVKMEVKKTYSNFHIHSKNKIFGMQPFFAIKTKSGNYYWDNLDFQSAHHWTYTFDFNNVPIDAVEKIGVASNTYAGVTEVVIYDTNSGNSFRTVLNT